MNRETAVFVRCTVNVELERVHQLKPTNPDTLFRPEEAYLLCLDPVDGLCTTHIYVPARDLAPILFPDNG